jgi:DNA-binding beta-propeller fold protein YncE
LHAITIGCLLWAGASGASSQPIERIATIDLPGVKGRIDHLAADVAKHRVFVAALGNDTVEVVDTTTSKVRTIRGLREPQGVLYLPDLDRLVVANAGGGVDLVDAASLATQRRIGAMDDADNVRYDERAHVAWIGFGDGALTALDPASGDRRSDIRLPAHPESFQLERNGSRAFVNVPSSHAVIVVDRTTRRTIARWETPSAAQNFPMAFDEGGGRLFVGARSPPVLLVYDVGTGGVVAKLAIGKDTDDVFFDAERKRVYVICGEGKVDVIRQEAPNRYVHEASIDTAPRARTGLFVAAERRLYVAAPAAAGRPARLIVYRVG